MSLWVELTPHFSSPLKSKYHRSCITEVSSGSHNETAATRWTRHPPIQPPVMLTLLYLEQRERLVTIQETRVKTGQDQAFFDSSIYKSKVTNFT